MTVNEKREQEEEEEEEKKAAPAPEEAPEEAPAEEVKPTEETDEKKEGEEPKASEADSQQQQQQQQRRGQKRKMEEEPFVVVEDEPEIDGDFLCLDWYNSDLNLKIDRESLCAAEPFYKEGWGYVWAGARATHGFCFGKVWFEVTLAEELEAKLDGEKNLHEVRVGWSTDESPFTLGEHPGSVCYSGTAKKGRDSAFEDFGATFAKGDVVGAFLDLDQGDEAVFAFTKNGEKQGESFTVSKAALGVRETQRETEREREREKKN